MLFNFRLRPVEDIVPWGPVLSPTDKTPDWLTQPHLGWFELTDGWYWIAAGQAELFRYHHELIEATLRDHHGERWTASLAEMPYVDYQVVRLWEDILDTLPAILERVPLQLAQMLGPDGTWIAWERRVQALVDAELVDWTLSNLATGWWWQRYLDSAYLRAGPYTWFWCDETNVHIQWDNRTCDLDGMPAWEANQGIFSLPTAQFLNEVRSFDARLMQAMGERVAQIQAGWQRSDVVIDPHLGEEHQKRSWWMQRCLDHQGGREPTDWEAVLQAIARIEALPAFAESSFGKG